MTNTTPTTVSYSLNAGQMITQAYRKLGMLPSGGVPTADQMNQGIINLNLMLKSWQSDGINLWRLTQVPVSVSPGQGTVNNPITISPPVLNFDAARIVITPEPNLYERPMGRITYDQYMMYPNKQIAGSPSVICFDKQENISKFYIYPLFQYPGTINMTVARPVLDVTQASDTIDAPIEWQEGIVWSLADRLMDDEGMAMADPATAQRITDHAERFHEKLLNFDRPDSVYFTSYGRAGQRKIWH